MSPVGTGLLTDVQPSASALFLPAPFLKPGRNEVVVFDLNGEQGRTLQVLDHPILDAPIPKNP